jgi:fructose-bisphosphate aldolase, class II
MTSIVVHYKELALKGRNRPWFISRLVRHLRAALAGLPVRSVRPLMGRLEITLEDEGAWTEAAERIGRVFGIANYSFAGRTSHDLDAIAAAILADLGDRQAESFRVSVRRADKRVPLTSPALEREIGGRIKLARGWRVDLTHPALTIHVEMLPDGAFYFFGKEPGAGGMPSGTGGRVACLLSGGIDSPVAAYRMMRRGCRVDLVHFHSYPILSHASQDKVRELAALLTRFQLRSRLALVPFGALQQTVLLSVEPPLRVVVYRRFMMRIAGALARSWGARALVTGEAIGQVASQTLENLTLIAEAAPLEVLRPLIGMDKDEIAAEAQRIGSYPVSIIPDQDCCQLFTPRHPATRARQAEVARAEAAVDVDGLVAAACDGTLVEDFAFPMVRSSATRPFRRSSRMTFRSAKEMTDALAPVATVMTDRLNVTKAEALSGELIDRLAWTAVFGSTPDLRGTARWIVRSLAASAGIRPASIHDLYLAMGRGAAGGFTVPAINVRAMAYDTARAVVRSARTLNAGAFIFEIARSEIGYTEQRPHEYAAVVLAAALREGFRGPVFIQGDHVQANAKKYAGPDRGKELDAVRALIREEIAAGFYNIDIDTSTLVDLSKPTLAEQQEVNVTLAAELTAFIRRHEPSGVTVSVGGEIGEVGGKNSDVHELHAFMTGYNAALKKLGPSLTGISKISVQTGTAHGGFVNADGTVRTDVKIDLKTLEELSRLARQEYGLGGAVQHGASTLPPDAFDAFPRVGACEIHLATDFQNMVYEHAQFPAALKSEMYAWIHEHAADERKPKDTEEQFLYKTRKKAIGPFKERMWSIDASRREAIGRSLEERFTFLMRQLKIDNTADVVAGHVRVPSVAIDRDAEVAAAGGTITAAEKKADGLAD